MNHKLGSDFFLVSEEDKERGEREKKNRFLPVAKRTTPARGGDFAPSKETNRHGRYSYTVRWPNTVVCKGKEFARPPKPPEVGRVMEIRRS